jgi:hypothetical protein
MLVATTALAFATPAAADWQYTKWGTTIDQVQKASKGALQRCDNAPVCSERSLPNSAVQLYGGYTTGQFNFSAYPMFNRHTSRLDAVALELSDPTMAGALGARYGQNTVNRSTPPAGPSCRRRPGEIATTKSPS